MNTNERKPVVSSTYLIVTAPRFETAGESAMYARGIKTAEAYFHDLITSGNIRVVEEVSAIDPVQGDDVTITICSGCSWGWDWNWKSYRCCPGCGNKIKR